ncbi:hypothetical protein M408DRAFT_142801 [Serendipita vermifera MAFF 305830]|uniref:Protein kinase domain-containing protein n=1 Tax=Serendipita vermifera MAFF 305830 TaxID=933852 RepID=A0A0C2WQK8_SERVB|nr:hypothetical protein M408DRAFT_142801 [Serendipita vermifera MAFF 305830]
MEIKGRFVLKDVVSGVSYLHSFNPVLVHGDLKPRNVLIDEGGRAQICDFGLSRIFVEEGNSGMTTTSIHTGTERYLAYELVVCGDEAHPTTASDIHAMGCIGLEFIFLQMPYSNRKKNFRGVIYSDIKAGIPPANPPIDIPPISGSPWTLLAECWDQDPTKRPDASQVLGKLEALLEISVDDVRKTKSAQVQAPYVNASLQQTPAVVAVMTTPGYEPPDQPTIKLSSLPENPVGTIESHTSGQGMLGKHNPPGSSSQYQQQYRTPVAPSRNHMDPGNLSLPKDGQQGLPYTGPLQMEIVNVQPHPSPIGQADNRNLSIREAMTSLPSSNKIRFIIVSAVRLIKRRLFQLPDPYAVVIVDDETVDITATIKKNVNPHWNAELEITVMDSSLVTIKVWDEGNAKGKDGGGGLPGYGQPFRN